MKHTLTAALMLSASALAFPAFAADLPVAPAPVEPAYVPPPAPVTTWSGFYVGVSGGYSWGEFGIDEGTFDYDDGVDDFVVDSGSRDFDADGYLVGGTVGYNYQINQFVVGVEADLSYIDVDESSDIFDGSPGIGAGDDLDIDGSGELDWLGTVRGRLGYAMDRFMVYGTGGVAFGGADVSSTYTYDDGLGGIETASASDDVTAVGYTVGAGIEGMVTDNITAKLEYLYVDFPEEDFNFSFDGGDADGSISADFDTHIVRGGLNYKFSF